jgi:CRP/FNR family transcriptional regulator, cyclic AMP receptor protein
MAIATSSLDFDRFGKSSKLSPVSPELAALQACPLFTGVATSALGGLAAAASLRSVPRGTTIAIQGSPMAHAFIVVRGRVRCVRRAANGREIALETFRPGDFVADAALAPSAPLASDLEAVEAATVLMIPRDALVSYLRGAPELALALVTQLQTRLERSKDLAVGLALSDVEGRVVSTLVALGRQDGVDGPEGLLIRMRPTQQEIANQIGACRETVSRTVSDLVRRGLVTPRGRSLLLSRRLLPEAA